MDRLQKKVQQQARREYRVRAKITGTAVRPRLNVHISNQHISAQLIDDVAGKTLAAASTIGKKNVNGTMSDKAAWVGGEVAKQAAAIKVKAVIFDRGPKLYHGRIKALADAAREKGLEF